MSARLAHLAAAGLLQAQRPQDSQLLLAAGDPLPDQLLTIVQVCGVWACWRFGCVVCLLSCMARRCWLAAGLAAARPFCAHGTLHRFECTTNTLRRAHTHTHTPSTTHRCC
jgi:hypothetical protein